MRSFKTCFMLGNKLALHGSPEKKLSVDSWAGGREGFLSSV